MRVIFNADDFGYSKGVNYGIIAAYQYGVVRSATMMVNMPEADHAFSLMRQYPGLRVGVHLTLTCGRPLGNDVPSLVDEEGNFRSIHDIFARARPEEIELELARQIEKFLASGFVPTHLDSHHHVHGHPLVQPIVLRLAERYKLPVRKFQKDPVQGIRTTDHLIYEFYGDDVSLDLLLTLLDQVDGQNVDSVEVMCHPAYVDYELLTASSYVLPRAKELHILTDPRLKAELAARGVQLISYAEL